MYDQFEMSFYENKLFFNNQISLISYLVLNMQLSITKTRSWKVWIALNLFDLKLRPIKICKKKDLNKLCLIGYLPWPC